MTKLRCDSAKGRTLAPQRPNAGVEAAYRKALTDLIEEMAASVDYWVKANYRKIEPQVAQDASPASVLQGIMNKLTARWRTRFNEVADELARRFVKQAQGHADRQLSLDLQRNGFAIKFKPSQAMKQTAALSAAENVTLIKSIPEQYLSQVEGAVMRSALAGGDLGTLTADLKERYGITHRRAAFIARDQNRKVGEAMTRTRQMGLGITEAIWQHSHGGKHPRESHVKAGRDKLRYRLDKGAYIDGQWIFPGSEPNCRCVSKPIIPGFDD